MLVSMDCERQQDRQSSISVFGYMFKPLESLLTPKKILLVASHKITPPTTGKTTKFPNYTIFLPKSVFLKHFYILE